MAASQEPEEVQVTATSVDAAGQSTTQAPEPPAEQDGPVQGKRFFEEITEDERNFLKEEVDGYKRSCGPIKTMLRWKLMDHASHRKKHRLNF